MMRGGRRMAMEGGDIKKQPWPTFPSLLTAMKLA